MGNDSIFNILRSDGSITVNKALIHALGINEAIIYSELLSRYYYFYDKDMLCDHDTFFNSVNDLFLATGIHDKSQRTAIKNLENKGLINCVIAGMPKKRYFKINFDNELISDVLIEGKQSILLLKNELEEKNKNNLKKLDKLETYPIMPKGIIETANKPINNTNYNNTIPIDVKSKKYKGGDIKRTPTKNNKSNFKDRAIKGNFELMQTIALNNK